MLCSTESDVQRRFMVSEELLSPSRHTRQQWRQESAKTPRNEIYLSRKVNYVVFQGAHHGSCDYLTD